MINTYGYRYIDIDKYIGDSDGGNLTLFGISFQSEEAKGMSEV